MSNDIGHAELELAQRYAANRLDAASAAAFEEHMLTCERCQEEVRLAAGLARVLRDTPPAAAVAATAVAARPGSRRPRWIAAGGTLLAAAIAFFVLIPSKTDRDLTRLGAVEQAPVYQGLSVRALPGRGDSLFAEGMRAYGAGRYDDAAHDLRGALAAGVDTIPATFWLATSELMGGRARESAENYARVIARGDAASSYLPEAHFYRAHAVLQLGRRDEAAADLRSVAHDSQVGIAAAALLQRVIGAGRP